MRGDLGASPPVDPVDDEVRMARDAAQLEKEGGRWEVSGGEEVVVQKGVETRPAGDEGGDAKQHLTSCEQQPTAPGMLPAMGRPV
jgi:hypothetical protein